MDVVTNASKPEEGNASSVQSHYGSELTYLGTDITSPMAKRVLHMNDDDDDHHHQKKKNRSGDQNDDIQHETSDSTTSLPSTAQALSSLASTIPETQQPLPQQRRRRQQQHNYQVRSLTALYRDNRRTNDEIHSTINLGPVVTCILDTPPMQRLRFLKQLGCADFVYMNVNHNRFEHSLGVSHLAETLCRKIRIQQPSLQCTEKDVLCVQLAGMCANTSYFPSQCIYILYLLRTHYCSNFHLRFTARHWAWTIFPFV